MVSLVEAFGFNLDRINGSHHIFTHPDIPELINIQNVKGSAKPYQVRQLFNLSRNPQLKFRGGCMKDYHINIFYSEDDEGYIADIPDLQFCSAFGATPTEALQELEIAKQAWLETARSQGKPVPQPTYRPIIYQLKTAS